MIGANKDFIYTQAYEFNTEGLTLSLVPGDVGKPTARSEKAVVNDGHCRWDIPVYETVKFLKDVKTGKVNQRIYHLIVSTTVSFKKIIQIIERLIKDLIW